MAYWILLLLGVTWSVTSAYYISSAGVQPVMVKHADGGEERSLYININGPSISNEDEEEGYGGHKNYKSPCDDPKLAPHLIGCQTTASYPMYAG